MKKLISLLLIFAVLTAFVGCGAWKPDITSESWVLEHAFTTDEGGKQRMVCGAADFLASGKYPDAVAVAYTLRAKDGKIEIKNTEDGVVYLGNYSEGDDITPELTSYDLKFGVRTGTAAAELFTDANTGKTEKLLTVTLAGYTMVFTAK